MLKYDEFESKNNGIKKRKRLKKVKKNDLTGDDQIRQEIHAKNVQLNGPSGFSKDFHNLYEKKHLKMEVKLTPEWVLDNMSTSRYADGKGVVCFYADEIKFPWVELALKTLGINYIKDEIELDCNTVISFKLLLEALKDECPSLYKEMWEMNASECAEECNRLTICNIKAFQI